MNLITRHIASALILLVSFTANAQLGSSGIADARSAGLAGTYNATAFGSYALGINPSNILFNQYRGDLIFILPFPQLNFRAGTDFLNLRDLKYFFGGVNGEARYLSPEEAERLNNLFDDGGEGAFGVTANLISFSFFLPGNSGAAAFSINDVFAGSFFIPQDAVDLTLGGNLISRVYSFSEAAFKAWWLRTYSLSYAREVPGLSIKNFERISAGISLKLIHGFMYAGTENVNSYFRTGESGDITGRAKYLAYTSFSEDIGISYSFDTEDRRGNNLQVFPAPAGSGFGVDIGFSAVFDKVWNFGLALTDIGSVSWKKRTARFIAEGDIILDELSDHQNRDSLLAILEGEGEYIDGFSTALPLALRMGAQYSLISEEDAVPGNLFLSADYNQGFNDLPGNSTRPRLSVGADWQPADWTSVRMGLSFGGIDGFNWSGGFGLGIGVLEIYIATTDMLTIPAPNTSRQISVAINSRWRFR